MVRNTVWGGVIALAVVLGTADPASADQTFSVTFGYFAVRGDDARVEGDVLLADRLNELPLAFRTQDFNGGVINGEYLVAVGDFLEAGVGIGFYQRTVPSVYERFVDSDGTEIDQDLKLRIVPIAATVRVLPLGRGGSFQPYVGAGLGVFNWRYSEIGEFLDASDLTNPVVFTARFAAKGTDAGPVVLGGVRVPVGDRFATGGEIRYQRAKGSLPNDFLGDAIDLGGYSYQVLIQVRF